MRKRRKQSNINIPGIFMLFLLVCGFCYYYQDEIKSLISEPKVSYAIGEIPEYQKEPFVYLDSNYPKFTEEDYQREIFESYSTLDSKNRVGVAFANIDKSLMPTEERGSIGMVKPSGWHTAKYDFVNGKYLYNRCHLIGYQLTGENANEKNLMTCTRSMNTVGMLPFENEVAEYIKENNDSVLYRVTPIFEGTDLLAKGVEMEAASVRDRCGKICFHVFVYNVEDGVTIDYATGESTKAE